MTRNIAWSSLKFWQSYHARNKAVDWFTGDSIALREIAGGLPECGGRVLHLGAGTSRLAEELGERYGEGVEITHADYSRNAVEELRGRGVGKVVEMDILNREDGERLGTPFDLVVDKGMLCVFVHGDENESIETCLSNIAAVTKKGGDYVMITNDDPDARMDTLVKHGDAGEWDLSRIRSRQVDTDDGFEGWQIQLKRR